MLGRTSFEGFRDYWPPVVDDDTQDPVEREISRRNNAIDKVVVSDILTPGQTGPWEATTRIVRRADATAVATELRSGDGGDILVFGSRTMWNHLLDAGLVDELHLMLGSRPTGRRYRGLRRVDTCAASAPRVPSPRRVLADSGSLRLSASLSQRAQL